MNPKNFFGELRRRNVHKVAITYLLVAWLLFEALTVWVHISEGPSWAITATAVLLIVGFVLIMYISWAFEATPEGLKRTENVKSPEVLPTWSRRKFAAFLIGTALLAAGLLIFDLARPKPSPEKTGTQELTNRP